MKTRDGRVGRGGGPRGAEQPPAPGGLGVDENLPEHAVLSRVYDLLAAGVFVARERVKGARVARERRDWALGLYGDEGFALL